MPNPVERDFKNKFLNAAETWAPRIWGATKNVTQGFQWGAEKVQQACPEKIQQLGHGIAKGARCVWRRTPDAWGLKTAAENAWQNPQYETARKATAAVGVGLAACIGTAVAAPFAIGTGVVATMATGIAAVGVGGATAAGTLMAQYSDHSILVNIPLRRSLELRTPGVDPGDPIDPKPSLAAIAQKSVTFNENQPMGMFAKRVSETLEDPVKAKKLKEQQNRTDKQKDRFIENSSTYASAYFIFVNRLGLKMQLDNDDDILMEMTQAATTRSPDGEKPNLWDACMSILERRGIELSIPQWIRGKFWYFLSNLVGIIPNTFKEVGDRILNHFRSGIKGEQSKTTILRIIDITSSFLHKYNGTTESYANAGQAGHPALSGDLADYRKKIIDELGENSALVRAIDNLQPGENLGDKVLNELCKEFVATLVDNPEIFPSIPFFKNLQRITIPILGIRIGIIFDICEYIFGGFINWIGKKLIKAYAPSALEAIVKKGIDQAVPGKYAFKIGIANALKAQVDDLKKDLAKGIPMKKISFEENHKLKDMIVELIKTLELNTCGGNQYKLREKFRALEHPTAEAQELSTELNELVLKGAQILLDRYTKKPEAMEHLFEQLFELSSEPFQVGAPKKTATDYANAKKNLDTAVNNLVNDQVNEGVRDEVLGEKPEVLRIILEGKRIQPTDPLFEGNPLYPKKLDDEGKPVLLLDEQGNPVYKGLFNEQKEKALEVAQVLKGLSLKMAKEIHGDSVESIPFAAPAGLPQAAAAANPAIAAAEAKVHTEQANVNSAKRLIEEEDGKRPEEQDPYERMDLENKLRGAKLELKIAKEELKVTKEIAKLENAAQAAQAELNAAQGLQLPIAERKLQAAKTKLDYAVQELQLVSPMEKFNRLDVANDHLLKNLDNYMKVIDDLSIHLNSLNIELYDEMVQKLFNRVFGPIYQKIVPLTEQVADLQALEKSYDKSKRLAKHFAAIGEKIEQNPVNILNLLREKLESIKTVDDSFKKYEEDPGHNVIPFATLIRDLDDLSKQRTAQHQILTTIQELGNVDRLSHNILAHPKKWVDDIRKKIPLEDQEIIIRSIADLQNSVDVPGIDLTKKHEQVATQYRAIIEKYTNLRQVKIDQRNQKLQEISNWANGRKVAIENKRNESRGQLMLGFETLKRDTEALADKIKLAKLPPMHFPAHVAAPYLRVPGVFDVPQLMEKEATDISKKIMELTQSAYDFLTSQTITEATSRLTLGEIILSHRRS
jgi:hypothetical protein